MKEVNYIFPLFLDERENLSPNFRSFLDSHFEHQYTPEEVLGYIYAILHAPTYREYYGDLIRIDFPRIPFPERSDDFEELSALGWQLIQAHLLREVPKRGLANFHGKGGRTVERVHYAADEETIHINDTQFFRPVPQGVWEFQIGGYQVLDKYLKSRKGRVLTLDEINHVADIADSLAFTIERMEKIDIAYRSAFESGDN